MRKLVAAMVVVGLMASLGYSATFNWSYGGADMNDQGKGTFEAGWLVQLYRDTGVADTLSGITGINPSTFLPIGGNAGDDTLLGSFTTSLTAGKGSPAPISWFSVDNSYASMMGASIYTIVYDSATLGGSSRAWVIDANPFVLPGVDSDNVPYSLSGIAGSPEPNNGGWVPVPEPATMALMGLGAVIIGLRRGLRKA